MTWRTTRAILPWMICGLTVAGCAPQHDQGGVPRPLTGLPFSLYTHCGIKETRIGNRYYLADKPLSDGQGNPPAGWDNPYQRGTITFTSSSTAIFRDSKNHLVTFRLRPRATGYLQICS